ncbi:MAG: hypothetical protein ACLQPN_13190 [Bryobacteraceae bacterium]
MSVWLNPASSGSHLSTSQGELLAVSIRVDPRRLEALLEALAQVSFPINPQIHHGAETVVEFPAYQDRVGEVERVLETCGFAPQSLRATPMLEEIHAAAGRVQ